MVINKIGGKVDNIIDKVMNDPFARYLGVKIEEIKEGYAKCSLELKENMLNFLGTPHGGVIFSLADVAFSASANNDHLPSFALDISGSFLRSAKIGDILIAESRLIHTTKRTGLYKMDVTINNELIATFNGTVFRKV